MVLALISVRCRFRHGVIIGCASLALGIHDSKLMLLVLDLVLMFLE